MRTIEKIIHDELSECNPDLVIAGFCYSALLTVFIVIVFPFLQLYDAEMLKLYPMYMSALLNQPLVEFLSGCFNLIAYLGIALVSWTFINILHMIALFFDFLQSDG